MVLNNHTSLLKSVGSQSLLLWQSITEKTQEKCMPLEVSRHMEVFELVKLYLRYGPAMSGNLVLIVEGDTTWCLLMHILVLKYMSVCSLTEHLYYSRCPYD